MSPAFEMSSPSQSAFGGLDSQQEAAGLAKTAVLQKDRRTNRRYAISVEFDLFRLRGRHRLTWAGSGRTIDWSRNSVLIPPVQQFMGGGTSVQLAVRWFPGVQLIITGRILSTQNRGTVVRIYRRVFRGKPWLAQEAIAASGVSETLAG